MCDTSKKRVSLAQQGQLETEAVRQKESAVKQHKGVPQIITLYSIIKREFICGTPPKRVSHVKPTLIFKYQSLIFLLLMMIMRVRQNKNQ